MTINPNAKLVEQACSECGRRCKIIMLPLCDECIDRFNAGEDLRTFKRGWKSDD